MKWKDRRIVAKLRPGILFAARLAEQRAWSHPNTPLMGAEQNLLTLAAELNFRLLDAEEGKIDRLTLPADRLPDGWVTVESDTALKAGE